MKIRFARYPVDVIICLFCSLFILPLALFDLQQSLRVILGLPFILFIPGYLLIFALFPTTKTDRGIDIIERVALSFGLSIAVVPLIGLGLNYTPWGIRLEPILLSLFTFNLIMSIIGTYRWYTTPTKQRFIISFDLRFPKHQSRLDAALTILLIITIIVAISALIYVIVTPKIGERFTEFYLLGPEGIADNYPSELTQNQTAQIIIGIANHEYQTINYTVEIWLINQTATTDNTTNETQISYHEMWYQHQITTTLDHTPINIEEPWTAQWEYNYTFSINKTGQYKLAFLLYRNQTEQYDPAINYAARAEEKLDNAYRETHLWITIG